MTRSPPLLFAASAITALFACFVRGPSGWLLVLAAYALIAAAYLAFYREARR